MAYGLGRRSGWSLVSDDTLAFSSGLASGAVEITVHRLRNDARLRPASAEYFGRTEQAAESYDWAARPPRLTAVYFLDGDSNLPCRRSHHDTGSGRKLRLAAGAGARRHSETRQTQSAADAGLSRARRHDSRVPADIPAIVRRHRRSLRCARRSPAREHTRGLLGVDDSELKQQTATRDQRVRRQAALQRPDRTRWLACWKESLQRRRFTRSPAPARAPARGGAGRRRPRRQTRTASRTDRNSRTRRPRSGRATTPLQNGATRQAHRS